MIEDREQKTQKKHPRSAEKAGQNYSEEESNLGKNERTRN